MKKIKTMAVCAMLLVMAVFSSCGIIGKKYTPKTCVMTYQISNTAKNVSEREAEDIYNLVNEAITNRADLLVADRRNITAIKEEIGFQQSDWSSAEKTAELGKVLNAVLLCIVTISDNTYTVEFVNLNTTAQKKYNGHYSVSLINKSVKVKGLKKLQKFDIKPLFYENGV